MHPDTINIRIFIAEAIFNAKIIFDRTPAYQDLDEEIFIQSIVIHPGDMDLKPLYEANPEFKEALNNIVKAEIHGEPDAGLEFVDARW